MALQVSETLLRKASWNAKETAELAVVVWGGPLRLQEESFLFCRCKDRVTATKGLSDYEVPASPAYVSREVLLHAKPSEGSQSLS